MSTVDSRHERYSSATAWPAEGARVGLVTCLDCGAAILVDPRAIFDPMHAHDLFHDRLDDLRRGTDSRMRG